MRTSFSTNQIILQGNVTNDPKGKRTEKDVFILKFGLATNRSVKVGEEYEDRTTFHQIVCIGKGAEWLEERIKKGHKVLVIGRQENRSYETEEGEKKYMSEVVAETVTPFLTTNGSKKDKQTQEEDEYVDQVEEAVASGKLADDIPF
jgi:single-strand DNA-binding protein